MKRSRKKRSLPNRILTTLAGLDLKRKRCAAVIVAAGSGSRMESSKAKQFMEIDDVPVIAHTLDAFERADCIDYTVVVTRGCDIEECKAIVSRFGFTKVARIVEGGATRQDSVLCGVDALDDATDYVAIHDGARCLITPDMIKAVFDEAKRTGSASAGSPVKNTIKQVDENNRVTSTPDRAALWQAQTPQIFKAGLYRAAAYYAQKNGFCATDDNSILEYAGGRVTMVDCGYTNIKITTPEDIAIAKALFDLRKEER
ncbi:MAG: 2-C-methyl-D-erythritol 4-phosphate cytidylyltransferase [Clostridia bacterium]|nr:2-C-methyl-D-erythritol 4-phosphate cytidylyltransferase [Clostridia bacterium]